MILHGRSVEAECNDLGCEKFDSETLQEQLVQRLAFSI